jgi:hypothetical protein
MLSGGAFNLRVLTVGCWHQYWLAVCIGLVAVI